MENLRIAFNAARQTGATATVALARAKDNLARLATAETAKSEALAQLAAAREIDSRRYAPGMIAARDAMDKATRQWESAWRAVNGRGTESTTLGAPFPLNGDDDSQYATRGQWCESPDSAFRFVGLSSDIAPDRQGTTGYYVDTEQDETARGVVYQMRPTRDGFARFIPAIADPFNSEKDGRGPAIMLLGDIITADSRDEDSAEEAKRDAARRAMDCAETYADAAVEYDRAWQSGSLAREALEEAAESRREFLELRKEANAAQAEGVARPVLCAAIRHQLESIAESWRDAKATAARYAAGDDDRLGWYTGDKRLAAAFREGLAG